MISEISLIRSHSSFWQSLFPGGEDFVRLLNSGLGVQFAKPIELVEDANRRGLINSCAFSLFELCLNKGFRFQDIFTLEEFPQVLKSLLETETLKLKLIKYGVETSHALNQTEIEIIKSQVLRLHDRYAKKFQLKMRPYFKGCGLIFQAEGDIYYEQTLVEIKAGLRNFAIQDLRQLYTYLALNHLSKDLNIRKVELMNPRTGIQWIMKIDDLSANLSANSTIEIFNEIIDFISIEYKSI